MTMDQVAKERKILSASLQAFRRLCVFVASSLGNIFGEKEFEIDKAENVARFRKQGRWRSFHKVQKNIVVNFSSSVRVQLLSRESLVEDRVHATKARDRACSLISGAPFVIIILAGT